MSVPFSAADAATWTGGELSGDAQQARFRGVSIDSRNVARGQLFIAIAGPNFDGHAFVAAAAARGAAGAVVERKRTLAETPPAAFPLLQVDDTTRALGALARGHRERFEGPLVAITGSNGKTTTKEMCAAILSVSAPCLKNVGNLNNHFGLPLTLLGREEAQRSVVVEVGMNHRGEIAVLAEIAQPSVGVLTNVGTAHIEYLGTREEIALEKGDLVAALPADGCAVLNGDDPHASAQGERTAARVLRFGQSPDSDVRPARVRSLEGRGFAFELQWPEGRLDVEVAGLSDATLANALAASAAALAAGVKPADIAAGLASYQPAPGRLARRDLPGDRVVIDDTYNANPQSMEVALRMLAQLDSKGRRLAVLGQMGELGETAETAHRDAGALAARLGIDFVFALGERAEWIVAGARDAGMEPERLHTGLEHAEIAARVRDVLRDGDAVLVKGSRAAQMERVVAALVEGSD